LRSSWSWSDGSWIYNYLCNQCLASLMLWVRILLRRGVLDTTLCDEGCQWLAVGFYWILRFPPEIKLKIVESGVKHHNPNPQKILKHNRFQHLSKNNPKEFCKLLNKGNRILKMINFMIFFQIWIHETFVMVTTVYHRLIFYRMNRLMNT
jgi:hypothetical protein